MRYADEALRQKLAAEYVLGTMPPRARRRFEAVLHQHPALRRAVTEWEERLLPLAGALPGMAPPAHVWEAVKARIQGRRPEAPASVWQSLAFWRLSTVASALVAIVLVLVVALPEQQATDEAAGRMVVVMNDLQTRQPAMTASWEPGAEGDCIVRLRVIGHAEMAPGTAWEMWMLPGGDEKPVSLGLITTHETQFMVVPAALAARLDRAAGLAMSVEPAGGSPSGLPTGPVLYAGPALRT
jgi:anti-sigma-K factor RskA